jgi:hypothetical protein
METELKIFGYMNEPASDKWQTDHNVKFYANEWMPTSDH